MGNINRRLNRIDSPEVRGPSGWSVATDRK